MSNAAIRKPKTVRDALPPAVLAAALLLALFCGPAVRPAAAAEASSDASPDASPDVYGEDDKWLCRPGRQDLCSTNEASTRVAADGTLSLESWEPAADPGIDCFYVYPTISTDKTGNSSLVPGPGEMRAVQYQFARFAAVCRPFAPMYRQITLAGLVARMRKEALPVVDPELGYRDVLAAWQHYLKYDNHGRGVVLIGHSQGARVLIELMRNEIDGKPAQAHLVSALILGMNVAVPRGGDVGGTFAHIPLCHSDQQTGCVVTYMSFRSNSPPTADSLFAHVPDANMQSGCTDPGKLSGETIRSILPTHSNLLGEADTQVAWEKMADIIDTPFVTLTGLVSTKCISDDHGSYLAVAVQPLQDDLRPHDIPGDIYVQHQVLASWGLHLVDVNLAMGNLVDIVRKQGQAFGSRAVAKK